MGERILITGGAGYIGTVMSPLLLQAGYDVTVVDRFPEKDAVLANCCRYEGFTPVKGDIRDEDLMRGLVAKADIIVPLAALVGAPLCAQDPIGATSVNREAVKMLLKHVGKGQRLVFPNSNSGYGVGEQGAFCTEESPLRPVSLYGQTKVDAEKAILDSGNGIALRLATVFGLSPRMRLDLLVNDFTFRAITDRSVVIFEGHFKRNYIHVRDVVKAFTHAIAHYDTMNNEAYNVGLSAANLSKTELCALIKSYVPSFTYFEAAIGEDPDKRDYIVSNAKLEATGWSPDWTLEAGINELIKGYVMISGRRLANL